MGEITREGVDATETKEARKKRKKAKKKLKKARRRSEGVVVPVRVPVRDSYSYFSHNKPAHQQSVDGWNRIAGYTDEGDGDGY